MMHCFLLPSTLNRKMRPDVSKKSVHIRIQPNLQSYLSSTYEYFSCRQKSLPSNTYSSFIWCSPTIPTQPCERNKISMAELSWWCVLIVPFSAVGGSYDDANRKSDSVSPGAVASGHPGQHPQHCFSFPFLVVPFLEASILLLFWSEIQERYSG